MALNDAVPSSATDVFKRNAEDTDKLLNQTANVVNRVGTTLETFPSSTGRVSTAADAAQVAIQADVDDVESKKNSALIDIQTDVDAAEAAKVAALSSYTQWNSRGDWATATAYAKGDIWNNTATSTWYLVLTAYTSGATVNDDIAGPNVTVLQGAKYGTFEGLSDAVAFVIAHPELFPENTALSTSSYRTPAECTTLGIPYPDNGGARYTTTTGLAPDGGSAIQAGALQLKLSETDNIPDSYPLIEETTSTVVSSMTEFANSKTGKTLTIDQDVDFPYSFGVNLKDVGNVALQGQGSIDGGIRSYVAPINSTPDFGFLSNAIKPHHLRQFAKTPNPRIVLFGSSSLSYSSNDSVAQAATIATYIQRRLTEDNAGKNISVANRAIPGQTWVHGNSKPVIFPSWYTDTDRDWIDYIEDEAPDVVFCMLGANDVINLSVSSMIAAVGKLNAFAKKPDIIFITHFTPSVEAALRKTNSEQEGADAASGWLRSYAKENDYGLIDVGRVSNIMRDGFDPSRLNYKRVLSSASTGGSNYEYTSGNEQFHGYAIRATIPNGDAYTNGMPLYFSIGRRASGSFDFCRMVESSTVAGTIALRVVVSGRSDQVFETGYTIPTGAHYMEFAVEDCQIMFKIGTLGATEMKVFNVQKFGGKFRIRFGYGSDSGNPVDSFDLNVGTPYKTVSQLRDVDEFGGLNEGGYSQFLPWGGNGENHMSSIGTQTIFYKTLSYIDMTCQTPNPSTEIDRNTLLKMPANQVIPNATLTKLPFTVETRGGLGLVTDGSNNITIRESGIYALTAGATFTSNGVGLNRQLVISAGGSSSCQQSGIGGDTYTTYINAGTTLYLQAGDTVNVKVQQNSGSNLTVSNIFSTFLSIVKIS